MQQPLNQQQQCFVDNAEKSGFKTVAQSLATRSFFLYAKNMEMLIILKPLFLLSAVIVSLMSCLILLILNSKLKDALLPELSSMVNHHDDIKNYARKLEAESGYLKQKHIFKIRKKYNALIRSSITK